MAAAPATLERKRNELGFKQVGMAKGIPIYVSTEGVNASESENRAVEAKLGLAMHQLLLSGLSSDISLRGKFNDEGKSDTNFWITGTGRDINYLITDSQEAEFTESQVADILKLAESGMMYTDIAQKLDIPAVGVYYALKKGSKKPRTSILCSFDKEGNLIIGKGDSIETTDDPLLFFVLRDNYARVGGARF